MVEKTEHLFVLLVRIAAGVLLLAFPAMLLPIDWMQTVHQWLGMGELPDRPIIAYLTRSLSGMYGIHGLLLLFVSFDVRRYLPLLRFMMAVSLFGGAALLVIDLTAGMPWFWTWSEGPSLIVFYGVLLGLSLQVAGERNRSMSPNVEKAASGHKKENGDASAL
jgi:hypothetical protein